MSIFIIFVYILLPAACFAHPADGRAEASSDVLDIFTCDYPDKQQDMNHFESCGCCAEHTPVVYRANHTFPAIRLSESSPIFLNTQAFIPIFVPPQNKS